MITHLSKRVPGSLARRGGQAAFTLVELLVAMAITALIAALILGVLQSVSQVWRQNTGRAQSFAAARAAFETITRSVSAATLNAYLDYYDSARNVRPNPSTNVTAALSFVPNVYGRNSNLHFVTGNNLVDGQQGGALFFTAPMDFEEGSSARRTGGQLNGVGFFSRFGPDPTLPSFISRNPSRYRLYQFFQPTGSLKVMNSGFPDNDWFTADTDADPVRFCYPLAANIVAFAVLPKLSSLEDPSPDSLTSDYSYNTRVGWGSGEQPAAMHQLPPVVRIVMVALDETSANRIDNGASAPDLGFDPATIFDDPSLLDQSLETISNELAERRLNYRVFSAEIPLRSAKWSP